MADKNALRSLIQDLANAGTTQNPEEITFVLNKLKGIVKVSEELLRETKAGLAVGKLRTHPSKGVSDIAKEIVKKWKAEVDEEKRKKATQSATPPVISPLEGPKALKSPVVKKLSPPAPPSPKLPLGPPARTAKSDGVKINSTGDKTRDKCMELIYDALASDSGAPVDQILNRATAIESTVFRSETDSSGYTGASYRNKMRSLYLNLKDKANPMLRESVVSGELLVAKFCTMTSQEMASEERKRADQSIAEQNLHNSLGAATQQAETDAFQCGRCKQRKTRYRQAQTRSADEPMTTFVTCVNCNNRWKFS